MDSDALSRWLTLGANLAVLLGIVLLVIELRQNQDIMRAQTRIEITQSEIAFLTSNAANRDLSDIVVRANRGEQLTEAEHLMYILRSEAAFRLWQNVHYQGRNGAYDMEEFRGHLDTMKTVLKRNPGLVAYWCEYRQVYPVQFAAEINSLIPTDSCN